MSIAQPTLEKAATDTTEKTKRICFVCTGNTCRSPMAAAVANLVFANAVTSIGWENLILVWTGLVAIGVIVALPYNKIFKSSKANVED
jgi:hypothetical protein